MIKTRIVQNFDYTLFGLTILLIAYGVLMIRSATMDAIDPDLINRVPRQITYAVIGLAMVIILALLDYRLLGALSPWIYTLVLGLLGLVAVLGVIGEAGAQRWLNVGIPVQPSELSKILLVITLAQYLSERYQRIGHLRTVLNSLVYVGIPAGLIFMQPDLGTAVVVMFVWFVMVWASGLRGSHILLFLIIAVIALPIIWNMMEPYQQRRIQSFINPEGDPDAYYNIQQALISVGSGGLLGKGYAHGTQSQLRFLRVRHTDFIFAVIAEELGFVGVVLVMGLMLMLLMRILRGARIARDPLGSLICYGVAAIIFFQTVVSIGMNLQLLPVTGLTLPFVSSGGSSLLTLLVGIGLVESVIVRHRPLEF